MLGHMFVVADLLVVVGGGGIVAQFADAHGDEWCHTTIRQVYICDQTTTMCALPVVYIGF